MPTLKNKTRSESSIKKTKKACNYNYNENKYCEIFFVRHALTENNKKGIGYDNYTKEEYYPILPEGKIHAFNSGKYFSKFGKFDKAFLSPRHRCLQTFEEINKSLNIPKNKVVISKKLLEGTQGIKNLMPRDKAKELNEKLKAKNKKWQCLESLYEKENNEFIKLDLKNEILKIKDNEYKRTSMTTVFNNLRKFLKDLETEINKNNYKRVICVGHSGTVTGIQEILQSGYALPHPDIIFKGKEFLEYGSTIYMAARYIKKEKRFEIVIPYNNFQIL